MNVRLAQSYKTYKGAYKRAAFENAVAPGEFRRGDKAHLYVYRVIQVLTATGAVWKVERSRA